MARYISGHNQPLGRWNNIPIYLTTILTALFVLGFIGVAVAGAGGISLDGLFGLRLPLYPNWSIWRLGTYIFLNPVDFFTPFSIFFFYWFSVGIETHLGRVALAWLLALLTLVPVVFEAFLWWHFGASPGVIGCFFLTAGLLAAFATLYPNTEALGWVPFKWMAFACIFCGSLMLLRNWVALSELWTSCLVGFFFIRQAKEMEYDDYESPLARFKKLFRPKPKLRVMPSPHISRQHSVADEPASELDVLLDKIAKTGMGSLTPKERAQLEKAREALMRKDQQ